MVINRGEMKRKRREDCPSPLLDESPKRTKVHAQRKFAQGSNVNSPVITPVKEIEKQEIDVLPEPVELLPIKRPNTEDFLTFLCFRGTPILPPSLNFFNTASIVDTNGQVHEIKSESPKNGPIDTSAITKTGSGSSERPFVAFGVRKRADPIVISRQMDKKRRHALALQALRRKYQEQRMAKIRAVTISKLSEKVASKTLLRSNSISKTEPTSKKAALPKPKVAEASAKPIKVATRSVRASMRPQLKQKMCLRSFQGRFVQKELQFRNVKKRPLTGKKIHNEIVKKIQSKKEINDTSEYSSDDEKPLSKTSKEVKVIPKVILPKIAKKSAPGPKKPMEVKVTRSNKFLNNKVVSRRQQIKQRMIMSTPKTTVKPRTLRSHTSQNSKIPESKQKIIPLKQRKLFERDAKQPIKKPVKVTNLPKKETLKKDTPKSSENPKKDLKPSEPPKKPAPPKASSVVTTTKNKIEKPPVPAKKESLENIKRAKVIAKPVPVTVVKKMLAKEALMKKKPTVVLKKALLKPVENPNLPRKDPNPPKKDTTNKKEPSKGFDEVEKKEDSSKSVEAKDNTEQSRTSQRPTRKTKEAAAIYMEILSHKLVNESRIDDDNVSIDSFPELPNVKKTEQRENELKAKARSTKTSESEGDTKKPQKPKEKEVEGTEIKHLRSNDKKKPSVMQKKSEKIDTKNTEDEAIKEENKTEPDQSKNPKDESTKDELKPKKLEEAKKINVKLETVKEEAQICDRKTRSSEKAVASPLEKIKEVELKVHINPISVTDAEKKLNSPETKASSNTVPLKKKPIESDSEESLESEITLSQMKSKDKQVEIETKRQTRNSTQNIRHTNSDDSDESFHADIRIPRKKQITRSKVARSYHSDPDESPSSDNNSNIKKSLRTNTKVYKESSSSESDRSTTSDVNVKQVKSLKNKKFTKTRSQQQKSEQSFSDSDEEPLSKLTQIKTVEAKAKEEIVKKIEEPENKPKPTKAENESNDKDNFKKPKRECAKRPQNYLPMLSSSDEEDAFLYECQVKVENKSKTGKAIEPSCSHASTTMDLSCKDIGRRFGKGKVNMSNEQIEKWLKDSAMAGNSVKCENDAMLKFGERIPTETSHSVASSIDTEKLKSLLIANLEKHDTDSEKKDNSPKNPSSEATTSIKLNSKPSMTDRKLIFRNKAKTGAAPNINAFSASNESSVYAFGEEEDVMKTPFRRPTRRPSSTATSRSEDESSKFEETPKTGQFRKPPLVKQDSNKSAKDSLQGDETSEDNTNLDTDDSAFYMPQPQKVGIGNKSKPNPSTQKITTKPVTTMIPPAMMAQKLANTKFLTKQGSKAFEKNPDASEDAKYKVPSSPSASSSSSAKLYKRQSSKPKLRATEVLPVKLPEFPVGGSCAQLIEAPTFHPSEKEFQDPLEYIEKIRSKAEQFGICRIVPPSTFKPECKVTDDMRFTAYNQYVHKMLHRWGPNFKELMAIKKYLSTQNISLTHPPWIGGMEIDLPRLYQTVQSLGGLKEVIEKKKWPRVSDAMKIPKSAQDRVTKLDDIYCKYLLPYDTLSPAEREKLFDEVETEWAKRESKSLLKAQQNIEENANEVESESDDEAEECIVKGRSMALNAFYRIARNTMSMWFRNSEPPAQEILNRHVIAQLLSNSTDLVSLTVPKIPMTLKGKKPEIASVIAPYQATSSEQLSLARGQLIMIRKKTDSGWWEGELQAKGRKRQVGWFPASYVKVLNSSGRTSGRTTPVSTTRMQQEVIIDKVIALFPYVAGNPDELSFAKDDIISVTAREEEAWWRGELNGVSGLFPSNYVAPLQQQSNQGNKKRNDSIREFIQTEKVYVDDMSVVHEVFEKPLKKSGAISREDAEKIFVNWQSILQCNRGFLEDLYGWTSSGSDILGPVITKHLRNMQVYETFCGRQLDSAALLQKLTETSAAFRDLMRKCQNHVATKGMPLSSFLIKPMQRITRYPLLISKIIENTPSDHPDYDLLQEALKSAEKFLNDINENVRQKENQERYDWLQRCVQNDLNIVFNSETNKLGPRKLIHFGVLSKVKSGKELIGFLFNDFFLLIQPSKSLGTQFTFQRNNNISYKMYKQPILIQDLSISRESTDHVEQGTDSNRVLKVQDNKNKYMLSLLAPTVNECNLWVKRIQSAKEFHNKVDSLTQNRPKTRKPHTDNVYCKVTLGDQKQQTDLAKDHITNGNVPQNGAPQTPTVVWNYSMQFQLRNIEYEVVTFQVFGLNLYCPDEFLGRAELKVIDILRETQNTNGPITKKLILHQVESGEIVVKLDLQMFDY